jgi:threonine/homoserine/homoserine lactone efflux protein
MLLQFVNIKVIIYGITAMSSYILPVYRNALVLCGFVLLLSMVGFSVRSAGPRSARLRESIQGAQEASQRIMALLLVYCAASLFLPS